jgi:NAD(P)-dependent dehydrogenase (short-subunit alcohol dehydrogenase family)
MSKLALSRAVRQRVGEWGGRVVRLNAIAPGPIDTPLLQGGLDDPELGPLIEAFPVPLDRRASADEIAAVAQFLLSDGASYVHGSIVFCDGGSDALARPDEF